MEVERGDDHGLARGAELLQEFENLVLGDGIDTANRLIEQQNIGLLVERPCDEDPLPPGSCPICVSRWSSILPSANASGTAARSCRPGRRRKPSRG
jgi:hypothetical protein